MSNRFAGILLTVMVLAGTASATPFLRPPVKSELHVVAIHDDDRDRNIVQVSVDRPGATVTLILSAGSRVTWEVRASPKTRLKKVLLAGGDAQVAAVPDGTELVPMYDESGGRKRLVRVAYQIHAPEFRSSVRAIHDLTGQEIQSYQGLHRYDPASPFIVNSIQDDPRLSSDYPKLSRAADVPKVRSQAVFFKRIDKYETAASYGDFTQAGPDRESLTPLPSKIVRIAYDAKARKHYGITQHEVHEVDLAKRKSTKLEPDGVKISWPRAVTFDTKRERLLISTSKAIYAYTPATSKWSLICELPSGTDLAALTYHAKDDSLYGLGTVYGREEQMKDRPVLLQFDAKGAVLRATYMPEPMFPGMISRSSPDRRVQIVSAGAHLAVLVGGSPPRDGNGSEIKSESLLFLVDPTTEKVTVGWKE
jgi:hypothetical protein